MPLGTDSGRKRQLPAGVLKILKRRDDGSPKKDIYDVKNLRNRTVAYPSASSFLEKHAEKIKNVG
jgi:hypothetical protein